MEKERQMDQLEAILYPRCFLKTKLGSFLSLFFKQIVILSPSELDSDKIKSNDFGHLSLSVIPWVASPLGDEAKELDAGIKALTSWGEQLGLGQSVTFETFYSALSSSQDEEVRSVMNALKGKDQEDIIMAARAFLSLSVEADKREDELDREIELVEKRAKHISQLVEDGSLVDEKKGYYFVEPLSKARERLRAWARLFVSASHRPGAWPVGESIAIKDLLDAAYEGVSGGKIAQDIMTVYLPQDEELIKNDDLRFRSRGLFADLLEVLDSGCKSGDLLENGEFKELSRALDETLDSKKWEKLQGPRLVFTFYPGVNWLDVMAEASGISKEQMKAQANNKVPCGSFFIL